LHVSLANVIAGAIEAGRLPDGERLPTHRRAAADLGVSVHTVGKAYDDLRRRGLVSGEVGRGTYVRGKMRLLRTPWVMKRSDEDFADLSLSRPISGEIHARRMDTALQTLTEGLDPNTFLACRPIVGLDAHREAATAWLARCGLVASARNVLITNGVSHGIAVALSTAARAGDLVATEAIGHHGIVTLTNVLGFRLLGLPIDAEGIVPEAFEAACREQIVRVLFTVPTLANPTVTVMPVARRTAIANIARRHGVTIIEDDAWGPVMSERPPPLAGFAPEISYYLTGFSKCLMPGIRAGYLVVPEGMVPWTTNRMICLSWMATPLIAEIASRWIADGTADELIAWQREALEARYRIVQRVMAEHRLSGHPHGLHFWLRLPAKWRAEDLVEHARLNKVAVAPAGPFLADARQPPNAVRVAIGAPHTLAQVERGLSTLAGLLARDPEPLPIAV